MVDEKFIVKMNKMILKKTGASFLVVYIIYVKADSHVAVYRYDYGVLSMVLSS